MPVRSRILLVVASVLAMASLVRAEVGVSIGAAGVVGQPAASAEAHGWVILGGPGEGVLLVHLPPRQGGVGGGVEGQARRVRALEHAPLAIAARGREVFMVFGGSPRRVLSVTAVPTPIPGIWRDEPVDRLSPNPPIPDDGEVMGLAAGPSGLACLLGGESGPRLLELRGEQWVEAELPEIGGDGPFRGTLLGDGSGLVLVRSAGGASGAWWRDTSGVWREGSAAWPDGATPAGMVRGRVVLLLGEEGEGGRRGVALLGPDRLERVGEIEIPALGEGQGRAAAVAIGDASGRLSVLWALGGDDGAGGHQIREVSLSTGRVLYEGPVERVLPVSAQEFRLVAALLVVVLVVSLFVVLRPIDDRAPVELPEGWALASPGRRLAAAVLDAALCAIPVASVFGVGVVDVLTGGVVLAPGNGWGAIPGLLGLGLVYGTVAESVFGTTAGKLLLGCRVARAVGVGGPRRVGVWAAFVRNLVKWALPPVAALALLETSGRHRGDLLARAVVLVRVGRGAAG
jgi:hypothetical protein